MGVLKFKTKKKGIRKKIAKVLKIPRKSKQTKAGKKNKKEMLHCGRFMTQVSGSKRNKPKAA